MSVRCPACSAERGDSESSESSACPKCGDTSVGLATAKPAARIPFLSLNDSLLPKATLQNATRDLFSLTGDSRPPMISLHGESLSPDAPDISLASLAPRASQASVMFSLDELKKAAPEPVQASKTADQQLWAMQAVTPLFGTADDAALLTAPLTPPAGSVEAVSVAQRESSSARKSLALWVGGSGLAAALLLGAAWLVLDGSSEEPVAATPAVAAVAVAAAEPVVPKPKLIEKSPAEVAAVVKPPPKVEEAEGAAAAVVALEVAAPEREEISAKPKRTTKKVRRAKSRRKKRSPKKKARVAAKFNKSKAKSALRAVARKAARCGKKGRAGGKGKVRLTFGTNGRVKSAKVISARFSGTSTGKCALRHFRTARIPAFKGKSVTVAKSFTVR